MIVVGTRKAIDKNNEISTMTSSSTSTENGKGLGPLGGIGGF